MVNKAKQEKGQVTKFALNVRQLQVQKQEWSLACVLRKYFVMGQAGLHPLNCKLYWADPLF